MDEAQIVLRDSLDDGNGRNKHFDDNVVFELKTFYEGPGGVKSSRFLKTTTIIATKPAPIVMTNRHTLLWLLTHGIEQYRLPALPLVKAKGHSPTRGALKVRPTS